MNPNLLLVFQKELQVDFKHCLEQTHVRSLVQTNLVLPDVDNQDLACRKGKQGTLSLKILVLASFAAVGTFNVHDQNVVGQLDRAIGSRLLLVLGHPYSLCGLPALGLGHDAELGAKEVVEQGGLSSRLGTEDGDDVVVEAGGGDMALDKVVA